MLLMVLIEMLELREVLILFLSFFKIVSNTGSKSQICKHSKNRLGASVHQILELQQLPNAKDGGISRLLNLPSIDCFVFFLNHIQTWMFPIPGPHRRIIIITSTSNGHTYWIAFLGKYLTLVFLQAACCWNLVVSLCPGQLSTSIVHLKM